MSVPRRLGEGVAAVAVLALSVVLIHGQDKGAMITVSSVPGRLVFPMEAGRNALLTVTVPAKNVRQVWLSPSRTFPGRVMLARTGANTYQVNLAEEIVHRVLQSSRGEKRFRIFAEDEKRNVYSSIAISYGLAARRGGGKVVARAWTEGKDGASTDVPHWRRYMCRRNRGGSDQSAPAWVSPGYTKRIGFYCDANHRAFFRSGQKKWPMDPSGEDKSYFTLNAEAEKVVRQTRQARVDYVLDDSGRQGSVELKVVSAKLSLPKGWESLTVAEHGSATVPGSDGYLQIHVGNIGSHRTLLTMAGADGRPFIRQTTVSQNSRKVFRYDARAYVLEVTRLHQSIFGSDYVVLSISPQPATTRKKAKD